MTQKAEIQHDTPIAAPDAAVRIIENSQASPVQKQFMTAIINLGQAFDYDVDRETKCILDVSEMFNQGVDIPLMRNISHEMGTRLPHHTATVALTAASGGNIFTAMLCEELEIPRMVYAAKEPNIIHKHNGFITTPAASYTGGRDIKLTISPSQLKPTDTVLISDDFLDTGDMTGKLVSLVRQAGARPVALAYAINKIYAGGNEKVLALAQKEGIPQDYIVSFLSIQAMREGSIWFDQMPQPFAFRRNQKTDPDEYLYREA